MWRFGVRVPIGPQDFLAFDFLFLSLDKTKKLTVTKKDSEL